MQVEHSNQNFYKTAASPSNKPAESKGKNSGFVAFTQEQMDDYNNGIIRGQLEKSEYDYTAETASRGAKFNAMSALISQMGSGKVYTPNTLTYLDLINSAKTDRR